jgi:hypothetical protein
MCKAELLELANFPAFDGLSRGFGNNVFHLSFAMS